MTSSIRIWTVQPAEVWAQLSREGVCWVDPERAAGAAEVPAYRWLQAQLKRRIKGYQAEFPWWGYCEKPDLRWVRHRRPAGQWDVRIELELSVDAACVFPSWAWHTVYCQKFLTGNQAEYAAWESALRTAVPDEDAWPLPSPWMEELEASWESLFSPDLPSSAWDPDCSVGSGREGVFACLRLEEVRGVTPCVGSRAR